MHRQFSDPVVSTGPDSEMRRSCSGLETKMDLEYYNTANLDNNLKCFVDICCFNLVYNKWY